MGGYGLKIYEYIKEYLSISKGKYEEIWNSKIYTNKSLRDLYNGIWMKIALQDALTKDISSLLVQTDRTDASYASRSTALALLLFCLDALAGDKYISFYDWLRRTHMKTTYTDKELHIFNEEYLSKYGVMKGFVKLFEAFIQLNLIDNYVIYLSKKTNLNILVPTKLKSEMEHVKLKWEQSSPIEKSHIIGMFYYRLHRNLFIHQGQTPIEETPEWVLLRKGETRKNSFFELHFYPEIGLLSGSVRGDMCEHLMLLTKCSLAKKIQSQDS